MSNLERELLDGDHNAVISTVRRHGGYLLLAMRRSGKLWGEIGFWEEYDEVRGFQFQMTMIYSNDSGLDELVWRENRFWIKEEDILWAEEATDQILDAFSGYYRYRVNKLQKTLDILGRWNDLKVGLASEKKNYIWGW